jgi:spore cortex formation protein SpoVR/YcgB (stage V sporulation)
MKNISIIISILIGSMLSACSTTVTGSSRESSAIARVEQKALSGAVENAFKDVDLILPKYVRDQKVFIETQALSKADIDYINGYLTGRVLMNGGFVVTDKKDADIKLFNIANVSGTDEIKRSILSDQVQGEYKGTLSIIDLKTEKVLHTYELFGVATEYR